MPATKCWALCDAGLEDLVLMLCALDVCIGSAVGVVARLFLSLIIRLGVFGSTKSTAFFHRIFFSFSFLFDSLSFCLFIALMSAAAWASLLASCFNSPLPTLNLYLRSLLALLPRTSQGFISQGILVAAIWSYGCIYHYV